MERVDVGGYIHGISLFNQAEFFAAHEALEDVWRAAPTPEKKFLQGLVQVAVAFHHYSTGNQVGMRSVLERAMRNLAGNPEEFGGIKLALFLRALAEWRKALDSGKTPPALPQIELCDGSSSSRQEVR